MRRLLTLALLLSAFPLQAQEFDPYGRGPYRAEVPRPDSLLGYSLGERQTQYDRQQWVLDRMIAAAPDRVRTEVMGTTVEGRPMRLVIVSSPANIARLDAIRDGLGRLADPRATTPAEARAIIEGLPLVVLLSHSIHGDEPGGFEAAMQTAYQLLASNEATTRTILDSVVVIINPSQNPDGHERFAVWSNSVAVGASDPAAMEQREPWEIVGRYNHYRFDMNRDALAQSQPESRALAGAIVRWHPQVVVDLHSTTAQYFFPPAALPINGNLPPASVAWLERFGRGNGAAFDRYGWQYYVRDIFDLFYAGYWDSWPSLQGATGMTYETDGGPELNLRRDDGTISTFADGIMHHFVASMATLETAALNRTARLLDYYDFRVSGMAAVGGRGFRRVIIVPDREGPRARAVVRLLARQGIEVRRAAAPFRLSAVHSYLGGSPRTARREFPAGSLVIDLAQPQARLATALLEPNPRLDTAFVDRQVARFERNRIRGEGASTEGYEFYDVTAWALPLTYGLNGYWTADDSPVSGEPVGAGLAEPAADPPGRAGSAYVFPNSGDAATGLALALLREDFTVGMARKPLRADGHSYPAGSFVLRVQRNPATVHDRVARLAADWGVPVSAVRSAFPDRGHAGVGSGEVLPLHRPRILLLAGDGVSATAFGDFWYYLQAELETPVTPVRISNLGAVDLDRYNVLILPGGSPGRMWKRMGQAAASRLGRWVESGGAIIASGGAVALLHRDGIDLTSVRPSRDDTSRVAADTTVSAAARPAPPLVSPTAGAGRTPAFIPGAIFRATLDRTHWLTLGYSGDHLAVPLWTDDLLLPSKAGDNPVVFVGDSLTLGGFVWPGDTERHLPGTVWAAVENRGRGTVVLFAGDPLFRAFWRGTARLVTNAILLGPGR